MDKRIRKPNKLSKQDKKEIPVKKMAGMTRDELSEEYDVSPQTISKVCHDFNKATDGKHRKELGLQRDRSDKAQMKAEVKSEINEYYWPEWVKDRALEYWNMGYDMGKASKF